MWKIVIALCLGACASAPKTAMEQRDLAADARATLQDMIQSDASLPDLLSRSAGYVVLSDVGKGGFIVGAAHGRGVLFEGGRATGFVTLKQASIGLQAGAQAFSELVVLMTPDAVDRLKRDKFSFGGEISAVALTMGAAGATDFAQDVAVFVKPRGGVMAGISVTGQQLKFDGG